MQREEIMSAWGFATDPFDHHAAETESRIARAFVAPRNFGEIIGNPEHPQPSFVFGARGEGKSTLCTMVAQHLGERDNPPLIVEATDFSGWSEASLDSLSPDDHIMRILEACVESLVEQLETKAGDSVELSPLDRALLEDFVLRFFPAVSHRGREARLVALLDHLHHDERALHRHGSRGLRWIWSYLRRKRFEFEQKTSFKSEKASWLLTTLMLIAPPTPQANSFAGTTLQKVFELFIGLVRRLGFPSVYVLIDKIDEIEAVANKPDKVVKQISPLARSLRFLETKGAGIKLFIPEEARLQLRGIRFDRIRQRQISWDDDRLRQFISTRVRAYSDDRHENLEHVFEDYAAFEPLLLRASGQTPRNMLHILDRVVSEHCNTQSPPARIPPHITQVGLTLFGEYRKREGDTTLYQARIKVWDREHASKDDDEA